MLCVRARVRECQDQTGALLSRAHSSLQLPETPNKFKPVHILAWQGRGSEALTVEGFWGCKRFRGVASGRLTTLQWMTAYQREQGSTNWAR